MKLKILIDRGAEKLETWTFQSDYPDLVTAAEEILLRGAYTKDEKGPVWVPPGRIVEVRPVEESA